MTADGQAQTDRAGLERWLASAWGEAARVDLVSYSTAGARRRNVIFDVTAPSRTGRFVATIQPNASIEILPVAVEAAVRSVARARGVPVPEIIGWSDDPAHVGGSFFVSEFVDGETIPRRVLRLVDEESIGDLVVEQLGQALARLHRIGATDVHPTLRSAVAPVDAALDGVEAAVRDLLQPEPAFAFGLRWLREHRPAEPTSSVLVHADVRTGNVIVGPDGLRAILDWETAKVGDPMEDLAWICTRMWRFGRDDLLVGGLGTLDTLRAAYIASGGSWHDDRFTWWRILTSLRWGLGLAGQAAAHLDGSYQTIVMAASGRRVPEMLYDALHLISEHRGTRPLVV